ncbi:unnamed protein product [Prunus armeniaca]
MKLFFGLSTYVYALFSELDFFCKLGSQLEWASDFSWSWVPSRNGLGIPSGPRMPNLENQLGGTPLVSVVTSSWRRLERRWLLSEYREEVGGLPLARMLRHGCKTVQTLIICLLNRRSVMPNRPKRGRLMSSLQEMELRLRG